MAYDISVCMFLLYYEIIQYYFYLLYCFFFFLDYWTNYIKYICYEINLLYNQEFSYS